MINSQQVEFETLYSRFNAPIASLDCGERCGPNNERGVPFCCDVRHTIPSAYDLEWEYLRSHTDLWDLWEPDDENEYQELANQVPDGHKLITCLGHQLCQREYRSLTCRSFPFFPYITRDGEFIGLSCYWEYEDRCWVISNLHIVSSQYRTQFIDLYDCLFDSLPNEFLNFKQFSMTMRRSFGRKRRTIPVLHRNGYSYKITPRSGRMRRTPVEKFPKYGVYKISDKLPFADEKIS